MNEHSPWGVQFHSHVRHDPESGLTFGRLARVLFILHHWTRTRCPEHLSFGMRSVSSTRVEPVLQRIGNTSLK